MNLSRRDFRAATGTGTIGAPVDSACGATQSADTSTGVDDPLTFAPNRDREGAFRDIRAYDRLSRGEDGSPGPGSTDGYEGRGGDEFGTR